jgi:hypothetical protein
LQKVFTDEKQAKQILQAAKRSSRKRSAGEASPGPSKRTKSDAIDGSSLDAADLEEALILPEPSLDEELISKTVLLTNRAPVVLAFAVVLLKYTTDQPLSSRLSLAQAVVSANSRSKAVSLGIEKGTSAEEEGWGMGQPSIIVMGRRVYVLKRWDASKASGSSIDPPTGASVDESRSNDSETKPQPVWGLDLESIRSSRTSSSQDGRRNEQGIGNLPIHTPQGARAYLLKAFASQKPTGQSPSKKQTAAVLAKEKEANLGLLLGALDLLFKSWSDFLSSEELDRRAWSWYADVRPDVKTGVSGWAEKNTLDLSSILKLRRKI